MAKTIQPMQENKKPVYRRNGSGELHVFDAVRYFEDTTAARSVGHKHYLREGAGRLSLDIPSNNNRRNNSIPLQAMMMEDRNSIPLRAMMMDQTDLTTTKNPKKFKQPSSPGGKLAHFLNSLFNQTYTKKSKSKSTTSKQSVKDLEDESPSSWRRKRRSSISLFRSGNSHTNNTNTTTTAINASDTRSAYNSRTPTKTTAAYKDLHKPTCEITKIPINENHNKIKSSGVCEKKRSSGNGVVEKVRVSDVKHDDDHDDHHEKYDPTVEIREFKKFILNDDDDGDLSDSSSDLFELTNCDLGYYSSGLPVFETTHMDNIKRGAPIVSS
ncbi:hypothetical protein L6452_21083 [Arctium lappa]|uniref:Uncharacterized protein n=1 Tax=Arctium lappa TaxID=4217 RepID=A0ACB9BD88_ARCLA|nr:hypothetical protein L6452_21083 [Arctium lappa]